MTQTTAIESQSGRGAQAVEGPLSNVRSLTVMWRRIRDSLQTIIQS